MKRSLSCVLTEKVLKVMKFKNKFNAEKNYLRLLKRRLKHGEIPYKVNLKLFRLSIKKEVLQGMDYYIINHDKHENKNKIMYFHGGAFVYQPTILHWRFLLKLAKNTKSEIWFPIYPKIPFYEAEYAYNILIKLYNIFQNTVLGDIILMGDSAGGGLVLGLAQQLRKMNVKQPKELVMISPWLDVSMESPRITDIEQRDVMLSSKGLKICGKYWAGQHDIYESFVSPLYGDISNLGRMTLFTGTDDILNVDARNLYNKTKEQGITINYIEKANIGHDYPLLPIPEAREVLRNIQKLCMNQY